MTASACSSWSLVITSTVEGMIQISTCPDDEQEQELRVPAPLPSTRQRVTPPRREQPPGMYADGCAEFALLDLERTCRPGASVSSIPNRCPPSYAGECGAARLPR